MIADHYNAAQEISTEVELGERDLDPSVSMVTYVQFVH